MKRKGDWIQTYTGKQFWPLDPRPGEIDIVDIAWALSHQCRFNGHSSRFYSVAEHSLILSKVCVDYPLEGLLHDVAEAYLPDVTRPLKSFLYFKFPGADYKSLISGYLQSFSEIEKRLMEVIAEKFSLKFPMPDEVKRIDTAILADEQEFFMPNPPQVWGQLTEQKLGIDFNSPYRFPGRVSMDFLTRFYELKR